MSAHKDKISNEQRRRKLLAEGALYRFGIIEARDQIRAGLTATGIAKSLLGRMSGVLGTSVSGLFSGRGNVAQLLQFLTPLLVSGVSLFSKRYVRKSVLHYGIISATVLLARYLVRKVKSVDTSDNASEGTTSGEDR